MREILFRGKRIDNGEFVIGFYVQHGNAAHYILDVRHGGYEDTKGEFFVPRWYAVVPETVGQYTGLTDKNGKKIFEGDIVVAEGYVYVCQWNECNIEFGLANEVESFGLCYVYPDVEVIGNIHDNPELLEGGADNV